MLLSKVKQTLAALAGSALLVCSGGASADYGLNLPRGVTPISKEAYDLHMLIMWICVAIGVVVFGAIRDTRDIRALGLPVFARAVASNAGEPKGFAEIGVTLRVTPGSPVVTDPNGEDWSRVFDADEVEVAGQGPGSGRAGRRRRSARQGSEAAAHAAAPSGLIPASMKPCVRCSAGTAAMPSTNASPSPGV